MLLQFVELGWGRIEECAGKLVSDLSKLNREWTSSQTFMLLHDGNHAIY